MSPTLGACERAAGGELAISDIKILRSMHFMCVRGRLFRDGGFLSGVALFLSVFAHITGDFDEDAGAPHPRPAGNPERVVCLGAPACAPRLIHSNQNHGGGRVMIRLQVLERCSLVPQRICVRPP